MQTIYLDISNKGVVPTVYAKQNDVGRKFAVILTDSGLPYIPEIGSVFSVWYKGASGEGNYTDIGNKSAFYLNGNKVEVEMIVQMLSAHGDGILCLTLNSPDGNQISSWNIPYMCEMVPGSESEKAEEYYTAFSESVEKLKQVTENLTPEAIGAAPMEYTKKVGNPHNLLDNSDFRNPVNQRGSTIFQAPNIEYWLDRWVAYGTGSSFTLEEGKVVISSDGTATCGLMQRVSVNSLKAGSKYTLAFKAKVIGAKCYLSYGVNNKDNAASSAALEENVEKIHTFTFTLPEADADSACYNFRIRSSEAEATMEIEWAALYEGEYTAETLPEYQPKGYAAELMECYRYFYKLINKTSSGLLTTSGTELRFGVETPIAMRTTPTLSSFEMSGLRTIVNTNIAPAVTDPLVGAVNGNVLALRGTVDLSEYIDSATYINNTPVAAYIGFELSADL